MSLEKALFGGGMGAVTLLAAVLVVLVVWVALLV